MSASTLSNTACPCGSGRILARCCGPYLDGKAVPRTAKKLMRSRYTAYALGGYTDYLKQTWHPAGALALSAADLVAGETAWKGLEVVSTTQQGDQAIIEFRAHFSEKGGPVQIHHERSVFARHGGRWYYLSGEVKTGSE